jgi:hypothetical protein
MRHRALVQAGSVVGVTPVELVVLVAPIAVVVVTVVELVVLVAPIAVVVVRVLVVGRVVVGRL